MAAQLTVFSARPAEALALADAVLGATPPRASAIRAATRAGDRPWPWSTAPVEAIERGRPAARRRRRRLRPRPYAQGIAHIAAQVARFVLLGRPGRAPATDPSGRWPVPSAGEPRSATRSGVLHPLFDGGRRLLQGQAAAAVAPLREAVAQQRSGEGLLRSEAVALLVVALAATGEVDEAARAAGESPPDRVAAVHRVAAVGRVGGGGGRRATRRRSRWRSTPTRRRAPRAARSAPSPTSPRPPATARVGAGGGRARPHGATASQSPIEHAPGRRACGPGLPGDGTALLEAAEAHAALGLVGDAAELAELAVAALGPRPVDGPGRGPRRWPTRCAVASGDVDTAPAPIVPLTRRELEIATLAARGLTRPRHRRDARHLGADRREPPRRRVPQARHRLPP